MNCDHFRPMLMPYSICISSVMLVLPQPPGTLLGPVQGDKGIALLFTFLKIIITSCNILIALDDVLDWPVVYFPNFGHCKTNCTDTLYEACALNFIFMILGCTCCSILVISFNSTIEVHFPKMWSLNLCFLGPERNYCGISQFTNSAHSVRNVGVRIWYMS